MTAPFLLDEMSEKSTCLAGRSTYVALQPGHAPATFAWTKPVVAPARWRRFDCFRLDVRIKQPHGRFEMRQIDAMLIGLTLKTLDRVGDFRSLVS